MYGVWYVLVDVIVKSVTDAKYKSVTTRVSNI